MIFEPLRRSLVRWLRPRATSVSPKITEEDIIARMIERGLIAPPPGPWVDPRQRGAESEPIGSTMVRTGVLRVELGETPIDAVQRWIGSGGRVEDIPGWDDRNIAAPPRAPSIGSQAFNEMVDRGRTARVEALRPGIKPPPDPAAEGWTWSAWKRELDAGALPGWAVCRFANRIGPDHAAFVFGIVRGSFGIWRQPFNVCAAGTDSTEHILTCLTHLRSGLGVGIFSDREVAAEAAEIAERVCPEWETLDPDDRAAWNKVHSRTGVAWSGIGVRPADDAHCHDQAGGTYSIYTRSPESMMAGRPEKLS